MAIENETADQVVRMVLQGSEVVLRLSGEAAMRIAQMIYTALKGDHTTRGKATLWEFLKSGKDQKLFRIPDEYLKAFDKAKANIKYVENARPGHDFRYAINNSKIKNELGWKPEVSMIEAVTKTVDWYLNNQEWVNNLKERNKK